MANPKGKTSTTGRTTAKGTRPASAARPKPGQVTSAKAWKSSARTPVELLLPSGNICLALNKGMQAFVEEGTVPNSLMPIVMSAIEGAEKGKKPEDFFANAAADDTLIKDMLKMTDSVLLACVREPEILPVPLAEVPAPDSDEKDATKFVIVEAGRPIEDVHGEVIERDPELLYVDEVDLTDKMFVFQWAVGGTDNVERFRQEFASSVEGVSGS